MAELLLRFRADVDAKVNGVTALHIAARNDGADIAELLLRFRADVNAVREETGWTALHYAVVRRNVAMAELLLGSRADVNAKKKGTGWTALHNAAICGNVAMVELLTRHGADVNAKDANARTPIVIAFEYKRQDVVKSMWNAAYSNLQDLEKDTNSPLLSKLKEVFAGIEPHLAATIFNYIRPVNFEDLKIANEDQDSVIELLKTQYDDLHKYVKMLRKAKEQQLQRGTKRKPLEPRNAAGSPASVAKKPEVRYP